MASHYYEWDAGAIHYKKSGMGDPILLVHGLYPGASSEEFEHNIRALSRDFRVYAIDLLGFGLSDAPRLRYHADLYASMLGDFIRDVIREPAGVIAAGASGPIFAIVASEQPDLVSRVVFISPPCAAPARAGVGRLRNLVREAYRILFLLPPFNLLFQEVMAGEWELREMLRRSLSEKTKISRTKLERLSELARMPGTLWAYASVEAGLLDLPFETLLPHISAPALFISGNCVTAEKISDLQRLALLPPIGRLEWIDRAAEWAHYESPTSTNRLIAAFLGSETHAIPATPVRSVA